MFPKYPVAYAVFIDRKLATTCGQLSVGLFLRRTAWDGVDFEFANDSVNLITISIRLNNLYDEKILELVLLG